MMIVFKRISSGYDCGLFQPGSEPIVFQSLYSDVRCTPLDPAYPQIVAGCVVDEDQEASSAENSVDVVLFSNNPSDCFVKTDLERLCFDGWLSNNAPLNPYNREDLPIAENKGLLGFSDMNTLLDLQLTRCDTPDSVYSYIQDKALILLSLLDSPLHVNPDIVKDTFRKLVAKCSTYLEDRGLNDAVALGQKVVEDPSASAKLLHVAAKLEIEDLDTFQKLGSHKVLLCTRCPISQRNFVCRRTEEEGVTGLQGVFYAVGQEGAVNLVSNSGTIYEKEGLQSWYKTKVKVFTQPNWPQNYLDGDFAAISKSDAQNLGFPSIGEIFEAFATENSGCILRVELPGIGFSNVSFDYLCIKNNFIGGFEALQEIKSHTLQSGYVEYHPEGTKSLELSLAHIAAYNGHANVLEMLHNCNCDLSAMGYVSYSPYGTKLSESSPADVAAQRGHANVLIVLRKYGYGLSAQESVEYHIDGITKLKEISPAYSAAYNGHANVLDVLREYGCDLSAMGYVEYHIDGITKLREISPAYSAAENGHANVLDVLREYGCDLSARGIVEYNSEGTSTSSGISSYCSIM